ncbi:hypothetical protein [Sulfidibacter corallicola]|uniref:Outer membrane lipoprotein-sorting protein n=1 Tax=Sulfidibacter corallicola TaxID=2818388 RepID=A0A8A4TQK3_SULCO|nr:hypothetical protein [Sulfidibacter corallicola]QTD52266.1 hypothetical protein J3U87_07310 [Sulfidibacter corallicola]
MGEPLSGPNPTTEIASLLTRHRAAIGGDRWSEIQAIRILYLHGEGDRERLATFIYRRPHHLYMEELGAGGSRVWRFDGTDASYEHGEASTPFPKLMPTEQNAVYEAEADLEGPFLRTRQKGIRIEWVGREQVEASLCDRLEATYPNGYRATYWIDVRSALIVSKVRTIGARETRYYYDAYRDFDGVLFPSAYRKVTATSVREYHLVDLEINPTLDATFFDLPKKPRGVTFR